MIRQNRMRHLLLLMPVALFATTGATCIPCISSQVIALPCPLGPAPTLEQIIKVINDNSMQIQSLASYRAGLSGPGFPPLRATVVFQRPGRLRLRAETVLTGPELDLGSNEEFFWFWVRRGQPPALYFCRQDQFAHSSARRMLAIEPQWLIEALGVVEFDPALPHQGPKPLPGDHVEISSIRETPQGPETRIAVIDVIHGIVLQLRHYDGMGRLIATIDTSEHRRDPLTGLVVPTVVQVECVSARLKMRIELGIPEINRLDPRATELWRMPNYQAYPAVDLANPRVQLTQEPRS